MNFDTSCRCGWLLPFSVMPMRNVPGAGRTEDDVVPNAIVTLVCPVCARGHSFFSAHEAVQAGPDVARKLGIAR